MDYIGSKAKLITWLFSIIDENVPNSTEHLFLDACSGTGTVSRSAAERGYKVIANDLLRFPAALANGSINLSESEMELARKHLKTANALAGEDGFFTTEYAGEVGDESARLFFTVANARKLDAFRSMISKIRNPKVRDYLLYCGIEAMSRVANTAGTHGAFLKKFKERALAPIVFKEEKTYPGDISVYSRDIRALLVDPEYRNTHQEGILYLDPPYNYRQYGANYHLYEIFALNDRPKVKGKTGLRNWKEESDSSFCRKDECLDLLKDILATTTAKYVFMSYSSDGLLCLDDIMNVVPSIIVYTQEYRRYKADSRVKSIDEPKGRDYINTPLYEYVFVFSL